MPTSPGFALREVRGAFARTIAQMEQMHADCQIKPNDVGVIQAVANDGRLVVECSPVVCRVPERASHSRADLYVAFAGSISFDPGRNKQLLTTVYGTNFGYFSIEDDLAAHVLGGHYDFSPTQSAHPRAHLQLRSQADMYEHVRAQFHSVAKIPLSVDYMDHVLNRVRPPTAQMDFLSFLIQVCADHLVDEQSSHRVVDMFEGLVASCDPVLGYHHEFDAVCECHRGPHWYPTSK